MTATFNPTLAVCQRNGRAAIILGIVPSDRNVPDRHVIAASVDNGDGTWSIETFDRNGRYMLTPGETCGLDLVNVPARHPITTPCGRHDAEYALLKSFPALALLCRIEAMADWRSDCDVCPNSKLTSIRNIAREAIKQLTGSAVNSIYPHDGRVTETDRDMALRLFLASHNEPLPWQPDHYDESGARTS